MRTRERSFAAALALFLSLPAWAGWPVLKTYEGEYLRRVKLPLGGIGTGTVSLSGRGSLVDWEIDNRPAKGYAPGNFKHWSPHFAIRCATPSGQKAGRLLEGPLFVDEYEGEEGTPARNHGFPRFAQAAFRTAYPFGQVVLSDPRFPVRPRLEAFNPLVPGDAAASGIPAVLFRWQVTNPTRERLEVSVVGSVECREGLCLKVPDGMSGVTVATDIREPGWNVALDRYWKRFVAEGMVADTPKDDATAVKDVRMCAVCVSLVLNPGETKAVPFVLAWRSPDRRRWYCEDSKDPADVVGNWYATRYPTAAAAADDLIARLPELEAKTLAFVNGVLSRKAPDVVKEAALFNLSTLRTETCFRTADGHFFGWEGCGDRRGSCYGSCTHVWGYEHALVDLWPDLARDMLDLSFGPALDPATGHMAFRVGLPLAKARTADSVAAADGQMQCIVKACEYWCKTKDDAWLKRTFPAIRKALAFCWIKGGWDADRDGVMEGCQHNTMDVEYYGPNPQMEFLYLTALEATARMAEACGEDAFAAECRDLRRRGSAWTEANLFNGAYYEHRIVPAASAEAIAKGLRNPGGSTDVKNPHYQLGAACLIDQLLGDFSAWAAGLPPAADPAHARLTLRTILEKCRREGDEAFNPMRGYAMAGEPSLKMAWYPEGRLPRSPFPYYAETMTGFEYVVAGLLAMNGELTEAERVVRDIRARYDGRKRNPFDEAECGHHYARALAAWTVLQAWDSAAPVAKPKAVLSAGWQVECDGKPVKLTTSRAHDGGSYQFASFDVLGGERVRVTAPDGTVETFFPMRPFRRVFDPNDRKNALVLFGNAPDRSIPDRNDPKVRWFGPGEHRVGAIRLGSNETLYLDPAAVVYGSLFASGTNITVTGRGILSGRDYPRLKGPFPFFTTFSDCTDLTVRGVTLTEPCHWSLVFVRCNRVTVDGVRVCGGNMVNDDGVDVVNSRNMTFRDLFVRTVDDTFCLKGNAPAGRVGPPCENISLEDATLWTDAANVFRIGYECSAPYFRNFSVRNVDVHATARTCAPPSAKWTHAVVLFQASNGMPVRDMLFDNLRVRSDGSNMHLLVAEPRLCGCFQVDGGCGDPYLKDCGGHVEYTRGGSISNIVVRNVTCVGKRGENRAGVYVSGSNALERVDGIRIQNCTRFGEPIGAASPNVKVGAFATATFETDAKYRSLHVDPEDGDDANDGRAPDRALKTLVRAAELLRAGDVLELKPGATFRESLIFSSSGTPEAPIVVHGNGAVLTGAGWKGGKPFHSGVAICCNDYIAVENLVAERFPNDGFNVHGVCRGLVFRNIVGRDNLDDGFSIHEQVMANVYGGRFTGNDYGIEDIGKSQSSYCGIVAESNRVCGISFSGGARIVRDAVVRGSGTSEIEVKNEIRRPDYDDAADPFYRAKALFELVEIGPGGERSLDVGPGATVALQRCSVKGSRRVDPAGECVVVDPAE